MVAAPPRSPARNAAPAVLLTGFEPFGGASVNPSWEAVQRLDGATVAGHHIATACLPTAFGSAQTALEAALRRHRPALVIATGLASGRGALSIERVAINVMDARIPDNTGQQPVDVAVIAGGPAAYFSTLPIKAMQAALQQDGLPAEVSQTAGTFVCNQVFYALMHRLARQRRTRRPRGGFIHVPGLPEQGEPSMTLEDICRGLRLATEVALTTATDLRLAAGALH